jgi:ligand-binding sensor domain-containing protein
VENSVRNFFLRAIFCFSIVPFFIVESFALPNFTNYQSVIKVNDILISQGKVWAASSGGLCCLDLSTKSQTLFSDNYCFPDLNLIALSMDSKGNLWIGSKTGYLYKRSTDGTCAVYNSYVGSGWNINDILFYKNHIIIASSKGCSIFDPVKGIAIRNATASDTFGDPAVNTIAVHNDSLYLGCNKSYNAVNIAGNNFLNNNYIDIAIWKSTPSDKPIVSFIDSNGTFIALKTPAVLAGPVFYKSVSAADSSYVYDGDSVAFKIPGTITNMMTDEKQNIWLGTDQNYFFQWNISGLVQYSIPGLTFNTVSRVYSARNGTMWALSYVDPKLSYTGISSFNGQQWHLFNRFTTPDIGQLSGSGPANIKGVCEDANGNMWFGTNGSNAKFFDLAKNEWSEYYVSGDYKDYLWYFKKDTIVKITPVFGWWGDHEAIALDSSGYLWFGNNDPHDQVLSGPLICYDYLNRHSPNFRRFFPKGAPHYAVNITSLCVDSKGKILASTQDGRLLILSFNGQPLTDEVTVEDRSDINATDICAVSNGISWIGAGKSLFQYSGIPNSPLLQDTSIQNSITCLKAESDQILWIGTFSDGLIRYDILKKKKTVFDKSSGLISNSIKDLSIDKKNGYLWIGTDQGVSQYFLGHTDVPVAGNSSIIAYPNPFSLSNPKHRGIIFKHCAPESKILVYSISGTLVKQLTRSENNFNPLDDNLFESTLYWVPSKKLAPGAYYFVGYPQKPSGAKKLLIIP